MGRLWAGEVKCGMDERKPIFEVSNHHTKDCGKAPFIDGDRRKRYHGYFENEYGEQSIFVYDYEVNEGMLWMGDTGWDKSFKVIEARVPELVLSRNEALWLYNCWMTATGKTPKQKSREALLTDNENPDCIT